MLSAKSLELPYSLSAGTRDSLLQKVEKGKEGCSFGAFVFPLRLETIIFTGFPLFMRHFKNAIGGNGAVVLVVNAALLLDRFVYNDEKSAFAD